MARLGAFSSVQFRGPVRFPANKAALSVQGETRAKRLDGEGLNMNDDAASPGIFVQDILKLTFLMRASLAMFDPDGPDHGRKGVKNALVAFQWFVARCCPDGTDLVLPINELLYAIHDLDNGRLSPMFHHTVSGGRPPTAFSDKLFRATAAVLMTLYQDPKLGDGDPATMVARKLNRLGYRDDQKKKITGVQVNAWRNEFRSSKGRKTTEGQQYQRTLSELSKLHPSDPKSAIRLVLSTMPAMHGSQITRKVRTSS